MDSTKEKRKKSKKRIRDDRKESLSSVEFVSSNQPSTDQSSSSGSSSGKMEMPLTAAEIMRRHLLQKEENKQDEKTITSSARQHRNDIEEDDIDDQIRRLEAELQNDDNDDSSSSSDDDNDSENGKPEQSTAAILSLSDSRMARIESLPADYLPAPAPVTRKRARIGITDEKGEGIHKKQKEPTTLLSEGLKAAVQEVLNGYKPRSAERLPFYCRCCAKQYNDADSFFQHKGTEFHKAAEVMERKASYCKLCRKQMTSPAQLQEHLKSRPHKERLQLMKSKRQQINNNDKQPSQSRRFDLPPQPQRHDRST